MGNRRKLALARYCEDKLKSLNSLELNTSPSSCKSLSTGHMGSEVRFEPLLLIKALVGAA